MAVVAFTGFEDGQVAPVPSTQVGTPAVTATAVEDGALALELGPDDLLEWQLGTDLPSLSAAGHVRLGTTEALGSVGLIGLSSTDGTFTRTVALTVDAATREFVLIEADSSSTALGVYAPDVAPAFFHVELLVVHDTGAQTGTIQLLVNGAPVAEATGVDMGASPTTSLWLGGYASGSAQDLWWDNVVVSDAAMRVGILRVYPFTPDGDGTYKVDLIGSDSDDVDNHLLLADDDDATYVEGSGGELQTFTTSVPAPALTKDLLGVTATMRAGAGEPDRAAGVVLYNPSGPDGGLTSAGVAIDQSMTTKVVRFDQPAGEAWSDVDSGELEIGVSVPWSRPFTSAGDLVDDDLVRLLGTAFDMEAFTDPHTRGLLLASQSSTSSTDVAERALDRDGATAAATLSEVDPWWRAELVGYVIQPSMYAVRGTAVAPAAWELQASDDGSTWQTLATETGGWPADGAWASFAVPATRAFRFLRLQAQGTTALELGELMLWGQLFTAAPVTGWSPAQIPDLKFWFTADDIEGYTDGDVISTDWPMAAGVGPDLDPYSSLKFRADWGGSGKPAVWVDPNVNNGQPAFHSAGDAAYDVDDWTIIFVGQFDQNGNSHGMMVGPRWLRWTGSRFSARHKTVEAVSNNNASTGDRVVLVWRCNGDDHILRVNGIEDTGTYSTTSTSTSWSESSDVVLPYGTASPSTAAQAFKAGYVADGLFVARAMTDVEILELEEHLMTLYGIS